MFFSVSTRKVSFEKLPYMAASSSSPAASLIDRLRRNDASISCLVIGTPQGTPKKDEFKIPEFVPLGAVVNSYFQGGITNQSFVSMLASRFGVIDPYFSPHWHGEGFCEALSSNSALTCLIVLRCQRSESEARRFEQWLGDG